MIKAVISDFGGVIVRTGDPRPRQALAQRYGMPIRALEDLVFNCPAALDATVGRVPEAAIWQHVADTLHLGERETAQFRHQFFAGDIFDHDLVRFLANLRRSQKTALLSNAWSGLRCLLSTGFPMLYAFDETIISAEVACAKPDADIFLLTCQRLSVQPQEAVFLDDFSANIQGAQSAGLHAVQFLTSRQARRDIAALINA
jgi:HAD superfamily hydrolase (TIGR01509 family)